MEKFLKLTKAKKYNPGTTEGRLPDKKWLIDIISTLDPSDEIFKKDYIPPPKKSLIEEQKTIIVPSGFFDGLPDSRSKVKRRALKVLGEGKAKQRIAYLKALKAEIEVQIDIQGQKVERLGESLKDPSTRKPADGTPSKAKGSKRQQLLLSNSGSGGGALNQSSISSKQP